MSTPERLPSTSTGSTSSTPAVPQATTPPPAPVEPLQQSRDLGWVVVATGAAWVLVGSWTLFPADGSDGMWAGYWCSLFGTITAVAAAWLRSTLPPAPGYALAGISGALLILIGLVQDYSTLITVPIVSGGAVILLGVALAVAGERSR